MGQRTYLVYLDILGFEELAEEIAERSGFQGDWVRENVISKPLRKRVETVTKEPIKVSSDSYLLMVDSVQSAFEAVGELTATRIFHGAHEHIPLELGLDIREVDEAVEPESCKAIIQALKNDIIRAYHRYCRDEMGVQIKQTFVLLTPAFFNDLEPLDKRHCEPLSCRGTDFFLADLRRVMRRARVFQFLKEIGSEGDRRYERIDEIYVRPLEYEDMANALKDNRLLLITGTAEYGKTYTAVRMMWEYYQKGYRPIWIKGKELAERIDVRRRLENITAELRPHHIIYFEDPFGTIGYERRETLEREIETIVDDVNRIEDVYVILTSREEVYKEFEKGILSSTQLHKFQRALAIGKPSYDTERRQDMLVSWADEKGCRWLENEVSRKLVLHRVKDERCLPTPLSIRAFAAVSAGIEEGRKLIEEIENKSEETARALAREMQGMSDDKVLLLSFLFVSDSFELTFVSGIYQELVEELALKDAWEFARVLGWFKDDRVSVVQGRVRFSHPSYSEALKHLLFEAGFTTPLNEGIFSRLLLRLSEEVEAAWHVAWVVADHFDRLPEEVTNELLLKLSDKDRAAWYVAEIVADNLDRLPAEVRNELLLKLSDKDRAASYVARIVADNLDRLPAEVRNELLLKLSERDETAWLVARTVARRFDRLPEEVRNELLLRLSERDETAGIVAGIVADSFDRLAKEVRNGLLLKLSEKYEAAGLVAGVVAHCFNRLPEEVRNLLFKLSEKDEAAGLVAQAVARHFDRLPEKVRNELLLKLSEKDEAAFGVTSAVAANLDRLPEVVRNLLFKLSERDEAAWYVAGVVAHYFDRLPEEVRNGLLLKLSEKDEAAGLVARAVGQNLERLAKEVRNELLVRLS